MSRGPAPSHSVALSLLLLGVTAFWGWTFVVIKNVVTGPRACPVKEVPHARGELFEGERLGDQVHAGVRG